MQDMIAYITGILKNSICFVPRRRDEEKRIFRIGQADIFLKNIPFEYWLPQGKEGKLSTGEKYLICDDVLKNFTVKINGQDLCASGMPSANFLDFSFIELYRKINNIGSIYKAVLKVENEFCDDYLNNERQKKGPYFPNKLAVVKYVTCQIKSHDSDIAVMILHRDGEKTFLPLYSCNTYYSNKRQPCCLPPGKKDSVQYNEKSVRDDSYRSRYSLPLRKFFITDDLELADFAQQKLARSDSRCWFSWYGGKDAVRYIDWNIFRNSSQVHYLIAKRPGLYFQDACDTAYEVYKELRRVGVSLKIIYALPGLSPIVIHPEVFFKYAANKYSPQNFIRRKSRTLFDDFFIRDQSISLFYGPRKSGTSSWVQQVFSSIKTSGILYILGVDNHRESLKNSYRDFQFVPVNSSLDVTTGVGQAFIERKLMYYEHQNKKRVNLLILDLKSLDKLSKKLEAVDCMIDWLEKLKQLGCAVILVPPGRVWTEKRIKTIKNIPFDNIIRIEKENSYGAHEIVISQHFELIDGADKFMKPRVWECRHAREPLVWEKVFDKNIEDDAIKYELTKLANRHEKNKNIALRLGESEELIKKLRLKYKLSKPQKQRPQKYIIEMNKHNKNVYETINRFLKRCSRDVMDILGPRFFDEIIIKMHLEKMSPKEIHDKIRGIYSLDIPLNLIVKETEEIDKAKSWLSRKLDALYPFLFFNSIPIQCREGSKNFDKTLYLASAVTMSGQKELLGMWLTESDNTKFIPEIVKSLKERGVQHFLLAFMDESLMEASSIIKDSFAGGETQRYIPDLIAGIIASVDSKNRKAVNADSLNMFTACTTQEAEKKLALLIEKWKDESSRITQLHDEFDMLNPLFKYSPETRKFIYSWRTSTLVGNALKELPKNELPTETAALKVLYREINASGEKVKPVRNWEKIMDELKNHFKVILEKL